MNEPFNFTHTLPSNSMSVVICTSFACPLIETSIRMLRRCRGVPVRSLQASSNLYPMGRILDNLFATPGGIIAILLLLLVIVLEDVLERIEEDTVRKRTRPCKRA